MSLYKQSILKLKSEGKSCSEISILLGCTIDTVKYHSVPGRAKQTQEWKALNLIKLKHEFGGCCQKCGYNKCFGALHFHHTNKKNKIGEVSVIFQNNGYKAAKKEAQKCLLICANCHAELHEISRTGGD